MSLELHTILADGSVQHAPFSQSAWEQAGRDSQVLRKWGHCQGECEDPVAAHWATLRKGGWPCTPSQHAWADIADPTWEGGRELVQNIQVPPPTGSVIWPPTEVELTPWALTQLTTLCYADARSALRGWREDTTPRKQTPVTDKRGQFSLF